MNAIASRMWNPRTLFYVANLPGDGGKDWEYTSDYAKALPLTPYWQRRFAAMCRYVGSNASFTEIGK